MTPQPQEQEYIITETLIRQWRVQCMKLSSPHTDDDDCKKCEYRGKGARERCCDLDDSDFEKMFRSRPAPSPDVEMLQRLDAHVTKWMKEVHDPETAAQARENAEQTDNILSVLKRRYKGEMAILDYVEMIECEVLSLRTGGER